MDSEKREFELMKPEDRALALNTETSIFLNVAKFEQMQRVASMLSQTDFIPSRFRGKAGNCMIALDMASRMGMDPLMLMRTMYVVHGEPGFEGKFVSALVNNSRQYKDPLDYEWKGTKGKPEWGCRAYAVRRSTGKTIYGPWVTWEMVVAEGWHKPKGTPPKVQTSKWMTMPEIMFLYRAATFFGRAYNSDLLMGMRTVDELEDIHVDLRQMPDGSFAASGQKPTADTYRVTSRAPASPETSNHVEKQEAGRMDDSSAGEFQKQFVDEFGTPKESPFEKSKWFHQRAGSPNDGTGFAAYVAANLASLGDVSTTTLRVMRDKFEKLYNKPWPYNRDPREAPESDPEQHLSADPQSSPQDDAPWYNEEEMRAGLPPEQGGPEPEPTSEAPTPEVPILETDAAKVLAGLAGKHKREYIMIVKGRTPATVEEIYNWIDEINQLVVKHAQAPDPDKF